MFRTGLMSRADVSQVFAVNIEGHRDESCNGMYKMEDMNGSEVLSSPVLKNNHGMYLYMYEPAHKTISQQTPSTWYLRNKPTPQESPYRAKIVTTPRELPLGSCTWDDPSAGGRIVLKMTQAVR